MMQGDKVLYDRNWRAPDSVAEVVEAVHNLVVAVYMIRNYSFEALALSRALHDLGYFLGVIETERQQMLWLEESIDVVLARNAQRGREKDRAPYTYTEVKNCLVQYLNKKGKAESSLYGIDPYGGRKAISQEDRMTESIVDKVEKRIRVTGNVVVQSQPQYQQQPLQQRGGGAQRQQQPQQGSFQGKSKEDKLRELCPDYNTSVGCSQPHGQCSKGKHLCSNNNGRNFVCLRKHSAVNCRNPQVNK